MGSFRQYIQKAQDAKEVPVKKVPNPSSWAPKKDQILSLIQDLPEDKEIEMSPIPKEHTGSSYLKDTIRLTGSREFIESILSQAQIKEFLSRTETDTDTSLRITYREIQDRDTGLPTGSYSCYIQLRESR